MKKSEALTKTTSKKGRQQQRTKYPETEIPMMAAVDSTAVEEEEVDGMQES